MTTSFSRKLAVFSLAAAGAVASAEAVGADAPKSDAGKAFCRVVEQNNKIVAANIIDPKKPGMPVFVLSNPQAKGDVYTGIAIDTKVMKPSTDPFVVDAKAKTCTVKGQTYEFGK